MVVMLLIGVIYFVILYLISCLFSLVTLSGLLTSTSLNYESGFYPVLHSTIRYRFSYWLITVHFVIFELELLLVLLYFFSYQTFNSTFLLLFLLIFLFFDLII